MTSLLKLALGITLLVLLTTTGFAAERLRLATTTSTENSGLLAELLPPFEAANDCQVDVIAVGTGVMNLVQSVAVIVEQECIGCTLCLQACPVDPVRKG